MEKRSRQRVRDQVAHLAFGAETRMRSKRARISMMARSSNPPPSRPDTEAQDQLLQIITFGLQRAAGPYRRANKRHEATLFDSATLNRKTRYSQALDAAFEIIWIPKRQDAPSPLD